ncbi:hypothetical protein LTR37_008059 [Vermiconidia calcicola]|uniref:Uncharacterized protein n=1 Tax=Vermiconidia calcicola TaxID=1690605 RepID=A0ACC3NCU5_9PEZI|nr:hypothetical protein LTR37_008059 [Vermiconidia calcicola]
MAPSGPTDEIGLTVGASSRRRERPPLAEAERKRAKKACVRCRRLKEKCDGSTPCGRCRRHNRACELPLSPTATSAATNGSWTQDTQSPDHNERMRYLEDIARHFLGDVPEDNLKLGQVVGNLQEQPGIETLCVQSLSPPVEGLSNEDFASTVREQADKRLHGVQQQTTLNIQEGSRFCAYRPLRSSEAIRHIKIQNLPPRDVATFLLQVYFDYAETNTKFLAVSPVRLETKIEHLYSNLAALAAEDAPWLCTLLMALAIGAQFSHMAKAITSDSSISATQRDGISEEDTGVSNTLYHMAATLIPDIIAQASVESVQAFLMMAHFALPIDAGGLARTYLGLSLRMAVQNGLHLMDRLTKLSEEKMDACKRLWLAVNVWNNRMGMSSGVQSSRNLPKIGDDLASIGNENGSIFFEITKWLCEIAKALGMLRYSSMAPLQTQHLDQLLQVRRLYKKWWLGLSTSAIPILQLNRREAHLHLNYHLNFVFMGRGFTFMSETTSDTSNSVRSANEFAPHPDTDGSVPKATRIELVKDAEYAAYNIIDICSMLDKCGGLASASYVECSCLRAAVTVMQAQSFVNGRRCHVFWEKLDLGLDLLRRTAAGNGTMFGSTPEQQHINAIDAAVQQMYADPARPYNGGATDDIVYGRPGYANFKKWASMLRKKANQGSISNNGDGIADGIAPDEMYTFGETFEWDSLVGPTFGLDPNVFDEMYYTDAGNFLPSLQST